MFFSLSVITAQEEMCIRDSYLPRIEFDSYEDFKQNYQVNVPDNFNFAYDIVDEWAKLDNTKKALVWCDDHGSDVYKRQVFMPFGGKYQLTPAQAACAKIPVMQGETNTATVMSYGYDQKL